MINLELCAGALNCLLQHRLTGCRHAASRAAHLLEKLAQTPGVDREMRTLCEQVADQLETYPRERCQ